MSSHLPGAFYVSERSYVLCIISSLLFNIMARVSLCSTPIYMKYIKIHGGGGTVA